MAGDKTERATPKRREEARKKGQVAKSTDLNGAVVLLAGLFALGTTGAATANRLGATMSDTLTSIGDMHDLTSANVGDVMMHAGTAIALSLAPIVGACAGAAIVVNVAQVGLKPKTQALRPRFNVLNPATGAKRLFGPRALVETGKNLVKIAVVGTIVMLALLPKVTSTAALVGMSPLMLGSQIMTGVKGLAFRASFAFLVIGLLDYAYQRWHTEKQMRMDKQEVKDESKGQDLPAEVKGAIRRRQRDAFRQRMMAAVPEADVIITNPTHYSVALKYDGQSLAPEVIAKGQDILALRIRELAADNGVPIVPDPPLARSLHASVEVGQQIPEELFQAVAQVLAYVYRVAGRRRRAA